ncbi:MAG TPA: serine hydroxymethyltransferase, partial [bacterium]|nr:serine hydroxymethyltransferase [bacterium]
ALDIAGLTVNKNTIPFDKQSPFITSGIRIGTPAVTSRGMKEKDMDVIADFINSASKCVNNKVKLKSIKKKAEVFLKKFPIRSF